MKHLDVAWKVVRLQLSQGTRGEAQLAHRAALCQLAREVHCHVSNVCRPHSQWGHLQRISGNTCIRQFASAQATHAAAAAAQLSTQHLMKHPHVMLLAYKQPCCLYEERGSQSALRQEKTLMTSDSFSTSGQCCSLVISTRTLLPDTSGEACSSSNTLSLANAGTCRYEDHFLEGNS